MVFASSSDTSWNIYIYIIYIININNIQDIYISKNRGNLDALRTSRHESWTHITGAYSATLKRGGVRSRSCGIVDAAVANKKELIEFRDDGSDCPPRPPPEGSETNENLQNVIASHNVENTPKTHRRPTAFSSTTTTTPTTTATKLILQASKQAGKARQGKARQRGKARQSKAKQGKAKQA